MKRVTINNFIPALCHLQGAVIALVASVLFPISALADNDITVTWLPDDMSAYTAAGTASVENILTISNLTYTNTSEPVKVKDVDDTQWAHFIPNHFPGKNMYSKDDYITFSVTVKEGYTFCMSSSLG